MHPRGARCPPGPWAASYAPETIAAICKTKRELGRVVAVGTTSLRALESNAAPIITCYQQALAGETKLFIYPPYKKFWIADALDTGKSTFHWGYVGKAFGYVAAYVGATLAIAVMLFEDRELS